MSTSLLRRRMIRDSSDSAESIIIDRKITSGMGAVEFFEGLENKDGYTLYASEEKPGSATPNQHLEYILLYDGKFEAYGRLSNNQVESYSSSNYAVNAEVGERYIRVEISY